MSSQSEEIRAKLEMANETIKHLKEEALVEVIVWFLSDLGMEVVWTGTIPFIFADVVHPLHRGAGGETATCR
jgi:hypothetical protein